MKREMSGYGMGNSSLADCARRDRITRWKNLHERLVEYRALAQFYLQRNSSWYNDAELYRRMTLKIDETLHELVVNDWLWRLVMSVGALDPTTEQHFHQPGLHEQGVTNRTLRALVDRIQALEAVARAARVAVTTPMVTPAVWLEAENALIDALNALEPVTPPAAGTDGA